MSHFILADRKYSLSVVRQVAARFRITALAQRKRRAKEPKNGFQQKVSLDDLQVFQYLTYISTEFYERLQESQHRDGSHSLVEADMIVRYIKHLVLIYLERNSFFSTVGQSCVLFDLSTSQTLRLYETLVQASPRRLNTKGDYSIRDAKREIRKKVHERFDTFITAVGGPRNEKQFALMNKADKYFRLTRESLHRMKPLICTSGPGPCPVPRKFNPIEYDIESLRDDEEKADPNREQLVEMRRMHAAIHPCCFARLLRASGYPYSRSHLTLPSFNLETDEDTDNMTGYDRGAPLELTASELEGVTKMLEAEAKRRKTSHALRLSVTIDGRPQRIWRLDLEGTIHLRANSSARIVEVFAQEESGEIPIALHLPQLSSSIERSGPEIVRLENGQQFTFESRFVEVSGDQNDIDIIIRHRNRNPLRALALRLRRGSGAIPRALSALAPHPRSSPAWLMPVAIISISIIVLCSLWLVLTYSDRRESQPMARQSQPVPDKLPQPVLPVEPNQGVSKNSNQKAASADQHSPPGKAADRSRGNNSKDRTRAIPRARDGKQLRDVRTISIETFEDGSDLATPLRTELEIELLAGTRFSFEDRRTAADAVLRGEITRLAGRRRIDARLVNLQGTVLWADRFYAREPVSPADLAKTVLNRLSRKAGTYGN